jgi:thiamine-monophosphate kinase
LSGGDDYELVFAAPAGSRTALAGLAAEFDLPLWRIGRFVAGAGHVHLLDENGQALPIASMGFDHFGQDRQ